MFKERKLELLSTSNGRTRIEIKECMLEPFKIKINHVHPEIITIYRDLEIRREYPETLKYLSENERIFKTPKWDNSMILQIYPFIQLSTPYQEGVIYFIRKVDWVKVKLRILQEIIPIRHPCLSQIEKHEFTL